MLSHLQALPSDPLLGLIQQYSQDPNPNKIDLGVGVYKNENGDTPVLDCVKAAEKQLLEIEASKSYVGPLGNQGFNQQMLALILGESSQSISDERVAVMQTPGGCGALRIAGELISRANRLRSESEKASKIWVSDPTWVNHIPLLGDAGVQIQTYPYYDGEKKAIKFDEMLSALSRAETGDIILLHACCHNPSGADLAPDQWQAITQLCQKNGLIPFIDMAYQGFAQGLEQDAFGLRLLAEQLPEAIVAVSCSKNFGLYRERVGLIAIIAPSKAAAEIATSNMMNISRGIYSMPPSHGASLVNIILADKALKAQWGEELDAMRERIQGLRAKVVSEMVGMGYGDYFSFIEKENGMFSFLGVSPEQVNELIHKHSIYLAGSGRINLAGLNERNVQRFCKAVVSVLS